MLARRTQHYYTTALARSMTQLRYHQRRPHGFETVAEVLMCRRGVSVRCNSKPRIKLQSSRRRPPLGPPLPRFLSSPPHVCLKARRLWVGMGGGEGTGRRRCAGGQGGASGATPGTGRGPPGNEASDEPRRRNHGGSRELPERSPALGRTVAGLSLAGRWAGSRPLPRLSLIHIPAPTSPY